ncbi:uncharacterized protein TM35_000181690 [Trypanosoma theileri]|uniref:Uncharacterized protein n=1 Tax=Trypanosoma theileri TaxID=67003 RepID=A0A1X0NTV8_9TRYP|nr:uncharacterized protein TM35_000181690 [Trypanosoma theileri]ORC88112.1 hypothetical protein TM35_000181690 [Trypanosoma theileri]
MWFLFNNSISENSRNKNENDSISHQDSKGFSWNPYKRLQVDTVVESTESSQLNRDKLLPSATSSTQESPALTSGAYGCDETPLSQPRPIMSPQSPSMLTLHLPPSASLLYKDDDYMCRASSGSLFDGSQWSAHMCLTSSSLSRGFPSGPVNFEDSFDMSARSVYGMGEPRQQQHRQHRPHQPYAVQPLPYHGQRSRSVLSPLGTIGSLQSGITCGLNGDRNVSTLSASISHDLSKCVLRFKKMIPPPLRYNEALGVLEDDNGNHPNDVVEIVKEVMCRWYVRIQSLKNDLFVPREHPSVVGTHGNNSSINRNRRVRPGLEEWCPEPPQKNEQGNDAFREWALRCNAWWEKAFGEKTRMVSRSRGGRGKGNRQHYHSQYPYNNTSFNDNNSGSSHNGNNANTTNNNNIHGGGI